MKFYSEKLDKIFDTEEELLAAESETVKTPKKKKNSSSTKTEENTEKDKISELEAAVEANTKKVELAKNNLFEAEQKLVEISKAYLAELAEAEGLLKPIKESLKDAENELNRSMDLLNRERNNSNSDNYALATSGLNLGDLIDIWNGLWM